MGGEGVFAALELGLSWVGVRVNRVRIVSIVSTVA
jgi:hypothetical protein